MKICIPTEGKEGMNAKVYGHFGSAPFFTVVDTKKKSVETIDNENQHHSHGMCQPMSALTGKDINAVVCGGMGQRAVLKLNEGGIKAYKVSAGIVSDIVERAVRGGLEEITADNACQQHGCH